MRKLRSVVGFGAVLAFVIIAFTLILFQGCGRLSFDTEYQAVFLDNGQVYFGKLSDTDKEFLLLNNVFYVQSTVNQETKQVNSILIKRGNEWHGPNLMRISAKHVVFIEPVGTGSKVQQLIAEANKEATKEAPKTK
jgi:hypothetical protein